MFRRASKRKVGIYGAWHDVAQKAYAIERAFVNMATNWEKKNK
jgi:hypothetical protein